jgi:hypothetical protein
MPIEHAYVWNALAVGVIVIGLQADLFESIGHRLYRFDQKHVHRFNVTRRSVANSLVERRPEVGEAGRLKPPTGSWSDAQRDLHQQARCRIEGSEIERHTFFS